MKDENGETVLIKGYGWTSDAGKSYGSTEVKEAQEYSFVDYTGIMKDYYAQVSNPKAEAYANLDNGLRLAAPGAYAIR